MTRMARRLDICICTFRRPGLEDTLRSLAQLQLPLDIDVRVIVADNDDTPSARLLVERVAPEIGLPVRYVHAPARNISIARNACLDASDGDLVAFMDDDETATAGWLQALVLAMDDDHADVVLGPVHAHYGPDAPDWMRRGDFHSTRPVWRGGRIRTGYTCNVLIRSKSPSVFGRRFRLELGQSGGEDTTYFAEISDAGGVIEYAPEAWLEEVVPASRATLQWLARRRFRMGQTHGRLIAQGTSLPRRLKETAVASAKLGFCAAVALLSAPAPVARNRGILRGLLHAGVIAGLMGVRELQQYGGAISVRANLKTQ